MPKVRLGVLVSGGGTNLQAIIDSIQSGYLPASIEVVLSNREDSYALQRAASNGIPNCAVLPKDFKTVQEYDEELISILKKFSVNLVILAGFVRVLSPVFVRAYPNRIMNIHPSLIPSFCGKGYYGLRVHKEVIRYGVKITGATVHFVDEGTDTGPIILQRAVSVEDHDTPETLAARVLKEEHRIYPEAIKLFAEGRLVIKGRRVHIIKAKEELE
ncbi:MAG: phosphoribosylglycinamide formyltransferase [Tepidanaerobacteraceae bacterium]